MPRPHEVRRDVQGLRALAVLAVVLFHASDVLPGGFVGVDIFFVISGFVIALSLLGEYRRIGRIRLRKFYVRRFKRLVPALALVVAVTLIASAFVLSPLGPQQTAILTGAAAMFSVANISIALTTGDYFDAPAELNPLLHTWSLSVEEQFYLVFPIALVIGLSLFARRYRGAFVVVALGTALSFGALMVAPIVQRIYETPLLGFYSPVVRAWEFGIGALIALWVSSKPLHLGRFIARLLYILGALAIGFSLSPGILLGDFPGPITLVPTLGTAAIILAGYGNPWGSRDPLAHRGASLLGDWSYSIYLWHWPFVSLSAILWPTSSLAPLVAAGLSFVPAIASFYLVENRFRFVVWSSVPHAAAVAATTVGIPLAVAGGLWLVASQISLQLAGSASDSNDSQTGGTAAVQSLSELAKERPPGYDLGCHGPPSLADPLSVCSWDFPDGSEKAGPIYLIGDSNAAHFTEGLRLSAEAEGRDLFVATASNCPLLDGVVPQVGGDIDVQKCSRWQEMVLEHLTSSPAGVVVLAGTDSYWLGDEGIVVDVDGAVVTSREDRLDAFDAGLHRMTEALTAEGHQVVLVQSVPQWRDEYAWSLDSCSLFDTLSGCNEQMPLNHYLEATAAVRSVIEDASDLDGAFVADFSPAICPGGICQTRLDERWVYRDGSHLSNAFSASLSEEWTRALERTAP